MGPFTLNAVRDRLRRGARRGVLLLLLLQALDLTTSAIPSPVDASWPARVPSFGEVAVRLLLCLPLLGALWASRQRLAAAYAGLPVPSGARAALAAVFLCQTGHIALRLERFPFSPVAMFSNAVPDAPPDPIRRIGGCLVLLDHPEHRGELISLFREGSPFARFTEGLDYKAGWVLRQYALTHSRAQAFLLGAIAEHRPDVRIATCTSHPTIGVRSSDATLVRDGVWFADYVDALRPADAPRAKPESAR